MTYRDIMVHLTEDPRNGARVDAALTLAQQFDAHVTALYTLPPPQYIYYMSEYVPGELIQQQVDEARSRASKAKAAFEEITARQNVKADWLESELLPVEAVETCGRAFDLIVLGQPDPDPREPLEMPMGVDVLPHELAMRAGRPILTIPYVGSYPVIGQKVMIAWNGSREATRAVHDAMPMLLRAKQVTVFCVNPEGSRGTPGADIARHLARHAVPVEVASTVADEIGAGDALLSAVADYGTDLLVMGAYGHSRLREVVFGGVTETVLGSMTVPVLLSN